MTMRSNIFVHRVEPRTVVVIDCSSPRNPAMSVTNDVENVVAFLHEWGRLRPGDRLIYKDTNGNYDGILYDGAAFRAFLPLGASSAPQAIERYDLLLDTPIDELPGSVL